MDKTEFKKLTKSFAINVAKFCNVLPYHKIVRHYVGRIVRRSASAGANDRAACRAKSKPDFVNKLRIVEEEAGESLYFPELIFEFYPERKTRNHVFVQRRKRVTGNDCRFDQHGIGQAQLNLHRQFKI